MKEFIIVLDFESGEVYIHHVYIDDSIEEETKITNLGHSVDNCQWMITKELNLNIGKNNGK